MKHYDVVALGELLTDFFCEGENENGSPVFVANPGGAPCNVLSQLSMLGRKTAFIGKVGKDMFGEQLERQVKNQGIDISGLIKDEKYNTTLAFVSKKENGDRDFSFFRNHGADAKLNAEEIDVNLIKMSKIFHFGSLSLTHKENREATKKAVKTAKESGILISFDPNLREPLWNSLEEAKEQIAWGLSMCDILKISDNEIIWFTGESDFDVAVKSLQKNFDIPLIFVSLGKEGSAVYSKTQKVFAEAFEIECVDATGAGDAFCAAVLDAVLEKNTLSFSESELKELLIFANGTGALMCTKKGALATAASRKEIEKFIVNHK